MKSRVNLFGLRPLRVLPVLSAALLVGCEGGNIEKYPQTIYDPRSDYAESLLELQNLTTYLGVAVGIIVFLLLAYIMVRFRYRPGAPEPKQVHGNTRLEVAWTFVPAIILAVIAVPTVQTIFATQPSEAELPANTLPIDVVGWQWWWEFRYAVNGGADTVVTANEIHVPVGTPVLLRITAGDVLHSFWVPQMGGKRDLIPNKVNHIFFTPAEPGLYLGACAEFCGDSHALMKMRLIAHTPEEYQRWLANEARPAVDVEPIATTPADSAILLGKKLVTQGACAGCHYIEGTNMVGRTGPNLTHVGRRRTIAAGVLENNAENMAAWIWNAPAVKPGAKMPAAEGLGITKEQIPYIVAYLQSLQ